MSFGNEIIDEVDGISQNNDPNGVRHLGVFFNKNGVINNISNIIEKIKSKLIILKNIYPNFSTRINIWKGYAISSLLYQSEILTITPKQIEEFEILENWFLFKPNLKEIPNSKKIKSNISHDRLELSQKYGGKNLKKILTIFSASKTKTLMRSFEEKNKNKNCYILLNQMFRKIYNNQPSNNFIHPLFYANNNDEEYRLNKNIWDWYNQASIVHSVLNKTSTFFPSFGNCVWDMENNIVHLLNSPNKFNNYIPKPIQSKLLSKINTKKKILFWMIIVSSQKFSKEQTLMIGKIINSLILILNL